MNLRTGQCHYMLHARKSAAQFGDFLRQLLEATLYLHDLHIIHTDLKPENILVETCDPEPENNEPR